ncbi:hypothetical protein [Streptomyces misionensis]|uniref:hypothetical protein n=1 Tax=Streptomyces misionensis TaxID=67331 RepID=UPI0021BD9977|nr:hypothetical protein [Streptomyces misionensis]
MLQVVEPVFFRLTTISFFTPAEAALKPRWSVLHGVPDAVVPVRVAAFFPVLPLVPVSFPPLVLPLVVVPALPLVSLEVLEEAPAWPGPPVELLAEAGVLLCAAVLEASLPPHAVNERPAAAMITARAEIFLTRMCTPARWSCPVRSNWRAAVVRFWGCLLPGGPLQCGPIQDAAVTGELMSRDNPLYETGRTRRTGMARLPELD